MTMAPKKRKLDATDDDDEEDEPTPAAPQDGPTATKRQASASEEEEDDDEEEPGGGGGDKEPTGDNGGGDRPPGPSDDPDTATAPVQEKPEKKKFRIMPREHCGTLLFCGGTNWDLIGRRELPKTVVAKGAVGRNLWGPHKLTALTGLRVRVAISGNSACHSVIVLEDGKVMTWGRNDKGQLGHGDTKRRDAPTVIDALNEVTVVDGSCGRSHTLLLTDSGHVFSFGDNKMGQCGVGTRAPLVNVPTKVQFKGRPIVKVTCGGEFSVVLDVKGYLFSFGCPEYGQLGHNTDGRYFVTSNKLAYSCELVPRRIGVFIEKTREGHVMPVDDVHIVDVACGTNHTIAMDMRKRCYTWGFGGYGRLGHAEPKDELVPRLVKFFDGPGRGVRAIYAGGSYSLVISEYGALYFWGQNKSAGEATMYPKPVQDLTGWNIKFAGCNNRSIVVVSDEGVISWGSSPTYGELGYGENKPKSSTTPQEVKPLDNLHIHTLTCGFGHTIYIVRDETEDDKNKLNKMPVY